MAWRYVHIREEDLSACSKVAHLKEGDVRVRRDSSLYPLDLDLVSNQMLGEVCRLLCIFRVLVFLWRLDSDLVLTAHHQILTWAPPWNCINRRA